jgi:cysteine synthase A
VTKNLEGLTVDRAYRVEDQAAFTVIQQLRQEEGLFLGLSSGINLVGAARFARERGPGQTIVTILCDSGHKYISKLYNSEWTQANQLRNNLSLETIFAS